MRNLTATICLTIAALLGIAGTGWSADYQKGRAAYERRDYPTAMREWKSLAEQGHSFGDQQAMNEMKNTAMLLSCSSALWAFAHYLRRQYC